jgi:hypothetical protein
MYIQITKMSDMSITVIYHAMSDYTVFHYLKKKTYSLMFLLFEKLRCFFVLSYYVYLRSEFLVVISVTISAWKWCSVRLYLQLFVGGYMYIQGILFMLFVFVMRIVVSNTYMYCVVFCFVFLHLVYPILPVSLDCPF